MPGLADEQVVFTKTINKIIALDPVKNHPFLNKQTINDSFISLKKYDCRRKKMTDKITFLADLTLLTQCILQAPVTHLKVELAKGLTFDDNFDSIANQAQKLIYLITQIKHHCPPCLITLVGHSQGGLVNLECACKIPETINQLISISTPYTKVAIANYLYYTDQILKLFTPGFLVSNSTSATIRYEKAVKKLCTWHYYYTLKQKWYRLSKRPLLHVICGTSALFLKSSVVNIEPKVLRTPPYFLPCVKKYPFDGLVFTSEQNAIKADYYYNFVNPQLPCIKEGLFLKKCCATSHRYCHFLCPLPTLHGVNTAITLAKELTTGSNACDIPLVVSMYEGVDKKQLTNLAYQTYYQIFADEYSHANLRYTDEVIALLNRLC